MTNRARRSDRQSKRPPLSVITRFINRAATLRDDDDFLKRLTDARVEWNATYPQYAVRGRGEVPKEYETWWGIAAPRALGRDLRRVFPEDPSNPSGRLLRDPDVAWAFGEWYGTVLQLCEGGWPPEYYPNVLGTGYHPSMPFVALCLIWNPALVPNDEVLPYGLRPKFIPFPQRNSREAAGHIRYEYLLEAVRDALRTRESIDSSQFEELVQITGEDAQRSLDQFRDELGVPNPGLGQWYVPLFAEMTTSDWRSMEADIRAHIAEQYGDDPIRDLAKKLRSEGLSKAKIAALLGISPRSVGRYVD